MMASVAVAAPPIISPVFSCLAPPPCFSLCSFASFDLLAWVFYCFQLLFFLKNCFLFIDPCFFFFRSLDTAPLLFSLLWEPVARGFLIQSCGQNVLFGELRRSLP
jgi:hypothetical protein